MIGRGDSPNFAVWESLESVAQHPLRGQVEVDLTQHGLTIGDLPYKTIFGCGYIGFEQSLDACLEKVHGALERGVHLGAGERLQRAPTIEVGYEDVECVFIVEPVAIDAHPTQGSVVAVFEALDEASLD